MYRSNFPACNFTPVKQNGKHVDQVCFAFCVLRFAFCVLRSALFSARPHDSRKDQFWTPVTIKQQYILLFYSYRSPNFKVTAVLVKTSKKAQGAQSATPIIYATGTCHGAWPKITQNEKRKMQNKLDRHNYAIPVPPMRPMSTMSHSIEGTNAAEKNTPEI